MTTRLHDGRLLDSSNFHIYEEFRKVTVAEFEGIALAWSMCADTPDYSIVIVKSRGVFAKAIGYPDIWSAVEAIEIELAAQFRRKERFSRNMVAVLNFAPTWAQAEQIARTGVDVLFCSAHEDPEGKQFEDNLKAAWFGEAKRPLHQCEARALIFPRFKLIGGKRLKEREHV